MNLFNPEILNTQGAVLLVDKPLNWTSFDVVNKLRFKLRDVTGDKKIKVGHAGTLDPLATGLLIICVGKKTKEIDSFMGLNKTYTGSFTFGASTPSFDLETEPNAFAPTEHLSLSLLKDTSQQFLGNIEQVPPIYSAIKKEGKKLYESAREGLEMIIEPRKVRIDRFEILCFENNKAAFIVACSKGTYIRSLAQDFGKASLSLAHLSALKRTHIGDYNLSKALSVEKWLETLGNL